MHELAERLLQTIRNSNSLHAGDRVAAAVSGGADSVALLCLLLDLREELGIVLSIAHVNHKLRGEESYDDERFVAQLAQQHGLELHLRAAPIEGRGGNRQDRDKIIVAVSGVEAAARELRYGFFRELACGGRVTKIATAHTLDDQAETILLRIFRGTGIRGLAGIHPRIIFEEKGHVRGEVVRPLLGFRRATLQGFLRERGQGWREDSSNQNITFLRNRVRHRLLPLIVEEFGESSIEHMSELAEIARAEEGHWAIDHPEITAEDGGATSSHPRQVMFLPLEPLLALPLASQRRLMRGWLEANAPDVRVSFRLIEEALELARTAQCDTSSGKNLELPSGWNLRLTRQGQSREFHLVLETSYCREGAAGESQDRDYHYTLPVPGAVDVPELLAHIEAEIVDVAGVPEAERTQLLDMARLRKEILIRNWRAGDRYWPAHTGAEKKVKELLSDRHATGKQKKLWPVAVAEGFGLVWLRGFAVPAAVRAPAHAKQAIWIREYNMPFS
ncbi:MAG: tRNA lysidine(34) synthetase TilS [Terriglobales bacterium]